MSIIVCGSLAYDTSKAAANHLVRELAVELSPLVRVNAVAPATVVKGSTMFPRDRVVSSLAKYDIEYSEGESDDELRDKLANFYAQRTLTIPLHLTGLTGAALVRIGDAPPRRLELDAREQATIDVTVPAHGNLSVIFEKP